MLKGNKLVLPIFLIIFSIFSITSCSEKGNNGPIPNISAENFNLAETQEYSVGFFPSLKIKIDAPKKIKKLNLSFQQSGTEFNLDLVNPPKSTGFGSQKMTSILLGDYTKLEEKVSFNIDLATIANTYDTPSSSTITISTEDQEGYKNTVTLKIKIKSVVNISQNISLKAEFNQFYSITENKLYNNAKAYSNQTAIDFIYGYYTKSTTSGGASIFSPNKSINFDSNLVSSWTTKNDTKIERYTLEAYQNLTSTDPSTQNNVISKLNNWVKNIGTDNESISLLKKDDVFAFILTNGNTGLVKIENVIEGVDGEIEMSIAYINQRTN